MKSIITEILFAVAIVLIVCVTFSSVIAPISKPIQARFAQIASALDGSASR